MTTALETAREYAAQGLAVIPLAPGSKEPPDGQGWRRYTYRQPRLDELSALFADPDANLAAIGGRVSGNLLMLDADSPQALENARRALDGLGALGNVWIRQRPDNGSPHDGGGALLLRTSAPVKSAKMGDLDILAEGRYGALPPSMHPRGGRYTWAQRPGPLPTIALRDLTRAFGNLQEAPAARHITGFAWGILKGKSEALSRYPSRSEAEYALCLSLCQTGFDLSDAIGLFRSYPAAGKFAELDAENHRNAERWLTMTWHNAEAWATEHPMENGAVRMAADLEAWALAQPWEGRAGATDLAVYLAHLSIVQRSGQDPYGAACRELGELAGVNRNTATKSTHRLSEPDPGLLTTVKAATFTHANRYQLLLPTSLSSECAKLGQSLTNNMCETGLLSHMFTGHNAFRWGALNKTGAQLAWLLYQRGEVSTQELEAETGRHRTTVKRKLTTMMRAGLADPLGEGVWRWAPRGDPMAALDEAAEILGTDNALDRQKARHRQNRAARDYWFARRGPVND